MIQSMTGFATLRRDTDNQTMSIDIRGVNNRGLDLKIRVPDGIDGLEQAIRSLVTQHVTRGSIQVSLRLGDRDGQGANLSLNHHMLDVVLQSLTDIENTAMARHINLAPSKATDILALRGILDMAEPTAQDSDTTKDALIALCDAAMADFIAMRRSEGQALHSVLIAAVDALETLVSDARALVPERQSRITDQFQKALAQLGQQASDMEQEKIAQEIALLLIKQDVQEELDRLTAHIAAARDLLTTGGAVGRRLDFLTQEFNREANTLCSKAQHAKLTQIGLDIKTIVDQIREQVQNVE